jgi:hypothetical protein
VATRELRALVALEALVLVVLTVAPLPYTLPIALPLLVAATLSRWVRGHSWRAVTVHAHPVRVVLFGLLVGAIALAIAAPLFGAFQVTAVEWWLVPAARGDSAQLALVLGFTIATSAALELAMRGWILERVWELSPGPPTLPIIASAAIEAVVLGGPLGSRIGAALFGAGLGLLYTAAGRSVLAPIAARAAFASGAIVLELLRA